MDFEVLLFIFGHDLTASCQNGKLLNMAAVVRVGKASYPANMRSASHPLRSSVPHLLSGFMRMRTKEKILLLAAWSLIGLMAAALRLIHVRYLAPLAGISLGPVGFTPIVTPVQLGRARMVRGAVLRAARVAPFRSDCFPQALAAAILCRISGVPTATHLGIKLDDHGKQMAAHAWVCSGSAALTGGHAFGEYTPVLCLVPRAFARVANVEPPRRWVDR